jgi:hypothetical protein
MTGTRGPLLSAEALLGLHSRCFHLQYDLPSTERTLADRQLGPLLLPVLIYEPLAYPSLLIWATLLADLWMSHELGQRGSG